MKYYYENKLVKIIYANCLDILSEIKDVSAVVTDPPYELGFMGKDWDSRGVSFQKKTWKTIRNSCKSGAMLLSFGGTRTFHRIAVAIEDAGWEFRDTIMYLYGSGFPKSLNISKQLDKMAGAEREVLSGTSKPIEYAGKFDQRSSKDRIKDTPSTTEAKLWEGYGTSLKPAFEPILVCMNPLDGTFANNALKHGVAGINIDECRVPTEDNLNGGAYAKDGKQRDQMWGEDANNSWRRDKGLEYIQPQGRFPSNVIHDGSQMVMELFPSSGKGNNQGEYNYKGRKYNNKDTSMFNGDEPQAPSNYNDNGSAARFFYCAKSSKSERNKGCEDLESVKVGHNRFDTCELCGGTIFQNPDRPSACKCENPQRENNTVKGNSHPTVKPLVLMEYLCKLVKYPEYNLILDPFMGSGTTLLACIRLGIPCIGIDSDEHSCEIASKRCEYEIKESMK